VRDLPVGDRRLDLVDQVGVLNPEPLGVAGGMSLSDLPGVVEELRRDIVVGRRPDPRESVSEASDRLYEAIGDAAGVGDRASLVVATVGSAAVWGA
jgi:hypothetical protein